MSVQHCALRSLLLCEDDKLSPCLLTSCVAGRRRACAAALSLTSGPRPHPPTPHCCSTNPLLDQLLSTTSDGSENGAVVSPDLCLCRGCLACQTEHLGTGLPARIR